jgi:hypothetical protein
MKASSSTTKPVKMFDAPINNEVLANPQQEEGNKNPVS